ncbi:MAG: hypothetical protein IJQ73_07795 [Kiritimatiellae bacterium]|nr:hypothetical protein [Kiritimatiellia bacterium]
MKPTYLLLAFFAMVAALAALAVPARERNTQRSNPAQTVLEAGEDIAAGNIVVVWTNGLAYAAADTNALAGARAVGVAQGGAETPAR